MRALEPWKVDSYDQWPQARIKDAYLLGIDEEGGRIPVILLK